MKLTVNGALVAAMLAVGMPASAQDRRDADTQSLEEQIQQLVSAVVAQATAVARDVLRSQGNAGSQGNTDRRGPEFTESFSRTIRLGPNGTFDLSNIAGDITVNGGGGDDVRIQATKRVRGRAQSDAQGALREIDIQIVERSGLVQVRTEGTNRRYLGAAVDYTIALPSGASLILRSVSGDTRVSNVKGEVRIESVSGNVRLSSIGRLRSLKSVSGDVDITDVDTDDLAGTVISGDLKVRNLKARSVEFSSVSGDVRFDDVSSDRVSLKTVSGDIQYSGRFVRNGRYELQSHSGDVMLVPLGSPAFDLDASTLNGEVRSDFALSGNTTSRGNGRSGTHALRGSVGQGGALVSIRTFSGDVVVAKR